MASKLTANQAIEILYYDLFNWDGTKKTLEEIGLNGNERWCDDVSYKCKEVLIPYSWTLFDPSEYEAGMGTRFKNGWLELMIVCPDSKCKRNSGGLMSIPFPDNKEDYDICLSVLGEDPEEWHRLSTRFLKVVK